MSTTNYPTHEGLERVLNTARAIKASAAMLTSHNLSLGESGFVFEWLGLSLVVLLALLCAWKIALPMVKFSVKLSKRVRNHYREQANDNALYAAALKDARIMSDLMAAKGRSESF
jgi:hypothetical protein